MEYTKLILPQEIYSEYLTTINNFKLSKREVDIIACILNGRTAKGIAHLLAISPKTAESHTYNVMKKFGCSSRENLIAIMERSDKLLILKRYYLSLLTYITFEQSLKDISKLKNEEELSCLIVYWKDEEHLSRINLLKAHLELAGIKTSLEVREKWDTFTHLIHELHSGKYTLYALSTEFVKNVKETKELFQTNPRNTHPYRNVLFLFFKEELFVNLPASIYGVTCISIKKDENYYFSIFDILKRFFPQETVHPLIESFREKQEFATSSSKLKPNSDELQEPKQSILSHIKDFLRKRKWALLVLLFVFTPGLIYGFLTIYQKDKNIKIIFSPFSKSSEETLAHSDLLLPSEATFLNRAELLDQVHEKLKKQTGIQTVALIGMGGAGKTTLARQYAHQIKAYVIWEINAETHESLKKSFENLAQALSKTEEDKKVLRRIQEIKNPIQREEKTIQFVKKQLKQSPNWFLVYDNVEKFSDIQKYFPQNVGAWGQGEIILTTRDSNIQNNKQVNSIIRIGELNQDQKLNLFTKIMTNGEEYSFTPVQTKEAKIFLQELPSYPLDISIAAYYVKATNIPYTAYLESMNQSNEDFINVQETLLKEGGDYTRTRYSIITISLQQLINAHKDFKDLLLFISLLDSQNIPRDLLNKYKSSTVVDNFIYHLKKYSLITSESNTFPQSTPTFSIHRSMQEISLAYFIKSLTLGKNHQFLKSITHTLGDYIAEVIEEKDFLKMKILISHCEMLLSHHNLLTNITKGTVSSELGGLYTYQEDPLKAIPLLEESFTELNKGGTENYAQLVRTLFYLGITYWDKGNYEKVKNVAEQCILIYKKNFPEDYAGLAKALALLGNAHRELGNYETAKGLFQQSLIYYKKCYPENHVRVAGVLTSLGFAYYELANYEEAKKHLEKSLKICKKHYAANHYEIGRALVILGKVHKKLGNYKQAQNHLEEAYTVQTKLFSEDHYTVAWILGSQGSVYGKLGNYKKAKSLIKKCLQNFEKNFGKNHLEPAKILLDLGQVYLLEGHLKRAEHHLRKSLEIFQQNKHPESYTALESLAELYLKKPMSKLVKKDTQQSQAFKGQAISCLKQALQIVKIHFPADSSHITRIQYKLKSLEAR